MKVNPEYYQIKYARFDRRKLIQAIRTSNEAAAMFLYSMTVAGCIFYIAIFINLIHKG